MNLTPVHLHGPLAAKYGKVHHLAVTSPAEAIRALCSQKAGFKADFTAPGASYTVLLGKAELPLEGLKLYTAGMPVHLVPVVEGNKSEFGQILAGAALLVASFYVPAAWGVTGKMLSTAMVSFGTSMVVGGISQILSPAPKAQNGNGGMDGAQSYLFNGPVNTVGQGTGIPILYGELTDVGSHVIGAFVDSIDPNMTSGLPTTGTTSGALITLANNSTVAASAVTESTALAVWSALGERLSLYATPVLGSGVVYRVQTASRTVQVAENAAILLEDGGARTPGNIRVGDIVFGGEPVTSVAKLGKQVTVGFVFKFTGTKPALRYYLADGMPVRVQGPVVDATEDPYTAEAACTSFAYLVDAISEGPIFGFPDPSAPEKFIKLNGTPIKSADGTENFKGVEVQYRLGNEQQAAIQGFPIASSDISASLGLPAEVKAATPITVSISSPLADSVSLRLGIPALYSQTSSGIDGTSVKLLVEAKDSSPGAVFKEVYRRTIRTKITSAYEWSTRISLDKVGTTGPFQFRVTRVTPDSTDLALANQTWFNGVAVLSDAKLQYPGVAHTAIKVDASYSNSIPARSFHLRGKLIQVPSNYNPETRVYTGEWDGTFKTAWSNNPAWCLYDLLTATRYGTGDWIKPSQVDKWALYEIGRYCDELVPDGKGGTEPRFVLNAYITSREEAYRTLQLIASNFHGCIYWAAGAVFVSCDKPADPSYLFTPANTIEGKFTYSGTSRRARHNACEIQWTDTLDACKLATELVELEDSIRETGFRFPTSRVAYGCTSQAQAIRDARWVLWSETKEDEVVAFGTGLDGAQVRPGDVVATHDPRRAGKGWGGRVKASNGSTIALDREVTLTPGVGHSIILTADDGRLFEASIASCTGAVVGVDLLRYPVSEGSVWCILNPTVQPELWRVLSVAQDGEDRWAITAASYDPSKYSWIETGVRVTDRRTWAGATDATKPPPLTPPTGLVLSEYLYRDKQDLKTGVRATWTAGTGDALTYLASWRVGSGTWTDCAPTSGTAIQIEPVQAPCTVEVRLQAKTSKGDTTAPISATLSVLGKTAPPANVAGFTVASDMSVLTFSWAPCADLDFDYTEIREGASWDAGTVVATGLTTTKHVQEIGSTRSGNFWAKHRDTSGNWSVAPANVVFSIVSPADDGVIDRREKPIWWGNFRQIQAEYNTIWNQAYAVGAYRTDYYNAYTNLVSYVNGLSPALSDFTTDTIVVPATWDSRWDSYYLEKTKLNKAITDIVNANANQAKTDAAAALGKAPEPLSNLPFPPGSSYPAGRIVWLTMDQQYNFTWYKAGPYKSTGPTGTWTALPYTAELLVGQLTANQIAANAIGVNQLAAKIIWTKELEVGYSESGGYPASGVKLDGRANEVPLKIGPQGALIGNKRIDAWALRQWTAIDGSDPDAGEFRVALKANNDPSVRSGAPNPACVSVRCEDAHFDGTVTHLRWVVTITTSTPSDNYDCMERLVLLVPGVANNGIWTACPGRIQASGWAQSWSVSVCTFFRGNYTDPNFQGACSFPTLTLQLSNTYGTTTVEFSRSGQTYSQTSSSTSSGGSVGTTSGGGVSGTVLRQRLLGAA